MGIRELPDFFALEHLARSLWRNGETRGAALLVGAGFSTFAKLTAANALKPPLWRDMRQRMAARIYEGVPDDRVPADPLRLAEEYQAALGRVALDDFIRAQVPDHAWIPGEFHDALLRLPWSDVLTTNWDSILERAAQSVAEIGYETVSVIGDIARAKSPRIVKLHGSIPSGPFIFTEEDYRTYPVRYAPFVNLARQIFLENELCLVGFSGTDPNFLQWSGWVRDNLGASTRRIYLVGALSLYPAARRLLEARNIAPIDLAPLVPTLAGEQKHAAAMKHFLDFLREAKPPPLHAWAPGHPESKPQTMEDMQRRFRDKPYAASLVDAASVRWQRERERYPGWIVCPYEKRGELRYGTDETPILSAEILTHITPDRRARVLYELAWRLDMAFTLIPDSLAALFLEGAEPKSISGLSKDEHLSIAAILLRTARESGDQGRFDQLVQLIERYAEAGDDFAAAVSYQKCLWYRDRLDFFNLSKELQQLAGADPIWLLRRAGLHCELAEYDKADVIITAALSDLRNRQQRDRNSLWVLSRRAWAQFLDRAADMGPRFMKGGTKSRKSERHEEWPLEFRAAKSDPWEELNHVEDAIEAAHRKEAEKTFDPKVHFDAGTYTEQGEGLHFQSWTVESPSYALDRLADAVGIPIDLGWVTILRAPSRDSIALQFEPTAPWYFRFLRTLRNYNDPDIERFFSRVAVARLSENIVSTLLERLTAAVEFWRHRSIELNPSTGKKQFAIGPIEKIRLYLEVISRLAVRVDPARARQLYDLALNIMKDPDARHWWLLEPLDHLLQRSGEAMPKEKSAELILPAIEFPLQGEIGIAAPEHAWPVPVSHIAGCPFKREGDFGRWNLRVQQLIEAVRTGPRSLRADAALRLAHMDDAGLLLPEERDAFGGALWARRDARTGLPIDTSLLAHVFLQLPAPDADAARRYFADVLYKAQGNELLNDESLSAINGAATPTGRRSDVLRPPREDALRILDVLLNLQPRQSNELGADMMRRRVARSIGPVISKAIMPVLNAGDFTDARVDLLFRLIGSGLAPSAMGSLALLVRYRPDCEERAVGTIRRAIVGRNREEINGAVTAIDSWLSTLHGSNHPIPERLVAHVVGAVANRREPELGNLIWCARRLLTAGVVPPEQQASLVEALRDLLDETKYESDWTGARAISMSVVRTECVLLARDLSALSINDAAVADWIEIGRTDPLPEIRWAAKALT